MRKTMHRWFSAWNFDKEEKWLNEMAAQGLALVSVGFCTYTFEESAPGDYTVRLELLDNLPTHAQSEQYIRFIEGSGAEYIGGIMRWVYFRKRKSLGDFDLYSDYGCRIRHLNRIIALIGVFEGLSLMYTALYLPKALVSGTRVIESFIGIFYTVFLFFLTYGIVRLLFKRRKLRQEHLLYE